MYLRKLIRVNSATQSMLPILLLQWRGMTQIPSHSRSKEKQCRLDSARLNVLGAM
jgi:hypothetical protein